MAYGLTQTVFKSKGTQQKAQQAKETVKENVGKAKEGGEDKPESPLLAPVSPQNQDLAALC